MTPPAPGRPYWICQAAGWGGFLAYVLAGYFLTEHPRTATDVVSIVFFNAVVGPAATHGLRHWMYAHDWHQLSRGRLLTRLAVVVVALASGVTGAVVITLVLAGEPVMPAVSAFSIAAGFAVAFAGWGTIYFAVQARRRRDAGQLELANVARDAQLRSLRAQLNPHFLFNCLNSLRHLIVTQPARAEVMVTGLAELLRYSLASDRSDPVELSDELRVVDEYLELERMRLEDRLTVTRRVEPDALHARIPPMLIQTLVDNAIKHGIAELPGGGIVRIEARAVNGRVEIVVANTGHLRTPAEGGGRGLDNTKARLRLIYGDAATFSLQETHGTVEARLALPMEPM
jgi:two-component system, LytTR family, sensor kinase